MRELKLRAEWLSAMPIAGAVAFIGGVFAVRSLQAAIALCLFVLLLAAYSRSRRVGMAGLWAIWLLAPALRRLLALSQGMPSADPLVLLPFVATGALALLEMQRSQMSTPARWTLGMAGLGFLIGAPMGLLANSLALVFALAAYLGGLSALVLGWADAREGRLSLNRVLLVALPAIAAYGIIQYFLPLSAWDANWISSVDLESLGAPQEGHVRVFSSLNSPLTLALVLVVGLLLGMGTVRRRLAVVATTTVIVVALALTFVRSAWLALVFGLLVYASAFRGRSAVRLVQIIAVCLLLVVVVGGSNSTTRAFTQRVTSIGNPSEDVSVQARLNFAKQLLPTAVAQPAGAGLGQAGLSVRLDEGGSAESLESTDNGYLALAYQLGLVGLLLLLAAMARIVTAALRSLRDAPAQARQLWASILAALVCLLVAQVGGEVLYGVTGAIFWYLAGVALAGEDASRSRDPSAASFPG